MKFKSLVAQKSQVSLKKLKIFVVLFNSVQECFAESLKGFEYKNTFLQKSTLYKDQTFL